MGFNAKFAEMAAGFELGIVPLSFVTDDVNKILANTPPEEARRMRRRFRKLWRKVYKQGLRKCPSEYIQSLTASIYGVGEAKITSYQARRRKQAVYYHISSKIARSLIALMRSDLSEFG